jgi:hypothetical protein
MARAFASMSALVLLVVASVAGAQITTYAQVKAQKGVKLSPEEARMLVSGAKIHNRTTTGSTYSWDTKANGTLVASSDGRGVDSGRNNYGTATGTWQIDDRGRFCVKIAWQRGPENWCRSLYNVGGKFYAVSGTGDDAAAHELDIRH